jgi:hypothetical protein
VRFTTTCVLIDLTTAIALSAADFAANRYATARAHEADLLTATGTSKTSPASITSPSQLLEGERSAVVAKMIGPIELADFPADWFENYPDKVSLRRYSFWKSRAKL